MIRISICVYRPFRDRPYRCCYLFMDLSLPLFYASNKREITSFGCVHYFIYQDGIISEMTDTVSFGSASKQKAAPLQIALVSYFVGNILHVLF